MSADDYLRQIISKYKGRSEQAMEASHKVYPIIKSWAGEYLMEVIWSGSIAKGTTVSLSSDADIFLSISSSCDDSLADIFNSLDRELSRAGFTTRRQNVSIRINIDGYSIDYTPGKRQGQQGYDHSIYKSKLGSWIKSNVKTHINLVKDSGRIDEIKICKIWRELNRIEFPSFYLELVMLGCLSGKRLGDLSANFWHALGFLSNGFATNVYYDPANSNNKVSDDLSVAEKLIVRQAAINSRTTNNWERIVW